MTDDMSERITISYQGHGELYEASLRSEGGLRADDAYEWLVLAIKAIGFETLADLVEGKDKP